MLEYPMMLLVCLFISLLLGCTTIVLSDYSGLCAQGSLRESSKDHMGCRRLNSDWLVEGQIYYHSGPYLYLGFT